MICKIDGKINAMHKGVMTGNGNLGAMLYGDEYLTLSLDRSDLWDERLPNEFRDKNFNYPYLSKCLKNNRAEASRLFDSCYNHSYPTKVNVGSLIFGESVSENGEFFFDTETATLGYNAGGQSVIKGYADANEPIIVLEIKKGVNFCYKPAEYLSRPITERGLGYPSCTISKNGRFFVVEQRTYGKNKFGIVIYRTEEPNGCALYITVYKNGGFCAAKNLLKKYSGEKTEYYEKHLTFWRNYYAQSDIKTCDKGINELYEKGRYFFGCNSRGKVPMTLQGVWTRNDGNLPPWKSDYHNDINVQMTYDAYLKTGNYEEGFVLSDFLARNKRKFKRFASRFMKTKGLLIPGVMSKTCEPLGGWPQYAMSPAVSIWALKPLSDRYKFFGDLNYLKRIAYPFFRDTEKCVRRYLSLNEQGYYELNFHSSPEYFEDGERSVFAEQTNFELTSLKFLYGALIEFCGKLGKNATTYAEIYQKLADCYRNENGEAKISARQEYDMSHRHFSHILSYKNFEQCNPFAEKETIKKDIDRLEKLGYSQWVGFSFVEAAGLYAYVHDGENAYRHLKIFEKAFTYPNGFHANFDYQNLGYSALKGEVLTLEANEGFVRSLSDMCLQEVFGVVSIFPAVPECFKKNGVRFDNLRLSGDDRVSAEYKNGRLTFSIKLKSLKALKIYNDFETAPTIFVDGKACAFDSKIGEIIEVTAEKEIAYEAFYD